ncbi:MAG: hypothetical protein QG646_1964 [Euryarchaeota archaeon]|nr:hypothetical protein [Euryarchaeota archaeon]
MFLKPVHFHKNIVLQATSKYERFRIKRSYFAYASTNLNITHLIGIYLFPSISAVLNAKIL